MQTAQFQRDFAPNSSDKFAVSYTIFKSSDELRSCNVVCDMNVIEFLENRNNVSNVDIRSVDSCLTEAKAFRGRIV